MTAHRQTTSINYDRPRGSLLWALLPVAFGTIAVYLSTYVIDAVGVAWGIVCAIVAYLAFLVVTGLAIQAVLPYRGGGGQW